MARSYAPRRIRMSRRTPWRREFPDAVIVARPSKWGNPFPVDQYGREEAIGHYRRYLYEHPELIAAARTELRGHDLACWCAPEQLCHADVLLEIANGGPAT